ncbi:MAG: MurR/RpiR family transcriptional regulator [Marinosulfonomonas sp.]
MADRQDKEKISDYAALVEVLKTRQIDLTPRLQDVAAFFLNHPEDVAILTIVEIARAASVPPSAVTRFSQALGFERFSDLQAVFQQRLVGRQKFPKGGAGLLGKTHPNASEIDLDLDDPMRIAEILAQAGIGSLNSLVQDLHDGQGQTDLGPFVQALKEAEAIHIIGNRGAFGVASYAFYGFSSVGKRTFLIDNFGSMRHAQLQSVGPKDVLLAISFDDYTPETLDIVSAAQEQGHKILAITDNELSPLWQPAQHRLLVKEARLGHFRSQVPAMVLLQTLIVSTGRHRAT